eukprot:1877585-Prymnesium_polylepis.3
MHVEKARLAKYRGTCARGSLQHCMRVVNGWRRPGAPGSVWLWAHPGGQAPLGALKLSRKPPTGYSPSATGALGCTPMLERLRRTGGR